MTAIRVALRVPVGRALPDLAAFIARCEDAGLDGVGIHDHPSSGRDAYLALALAAEATHCLRLFPATSSPLVRHPLVLASLAHSLEEIAPGRICLTVAPGFISARSIGVRRAPVAIMRDATCGGCSPARPSRSARPRRACGTGARHRRRFICWRRAPA
jgi:5,10-methylenetetrahydromethanopterin reductase